MSIGGDTARAGHPDAGRIEQFRLGGCRAGIAARQAAQCRVVELESFDAGGFGCPGTVGRLIKR